MNQRFFRFDWRQPVNQWLGIALISLMCFWVVLYYFVHTSQALAANYSAAVQESQKY